MTFEHALKVPIFIGIAAGNYTGGITLLADQSLIGANQALVLNSITLATAGIDPVITSAQIVTGGVVAVVSELDAGAFTDGASVSFAIAHSAFFCDEGQVLELD